MKSPRIAGPARARQSPLWGSRSVCCTIAFRRSGQWEPDGQLDVGAVVTSRLASASRRSRTLIDHVKRSGPGALALALRRRWQAGRSLADLHPVRRLPPLRDDEIFCVLGVRDEIERLPDFFRHYRELGVDRFLAVDNGSVDGTLELLADQPDAEVWSTRASFRAAGSGAHWASGLARRLASGHWGVIADADEHLVYDGCERHGLRDLVRRLESAGRMSLPAMMLDLYPDGPIAGAALGAGVRLRTLCPLFDGEGYRPAARRFGEADPSIRKFDGGPRQRLFASPGRPFYCELAKTPFFRWAPEVTLIDSHRVHPYRLNFGEPTGLLLHFKLMADARPRAEAAVALGEHFDGAIVYRRSLPRLQAEPDLSAVWSGSRRYENSGSAVAAGLMTPIDWSPSA
jgi:hypothetical protein